MNPVQAMTEQLQEAYIKAGEDMGKQMSAAVVAILTEVTSGQGIPCVSGWPKDQVPEGLKSILPADKVGDFQWVMIVSADIVEVPLFQGEPIWATELTSGHRLLVLG